MHDHEENSQAGLSYAPPYDKTKEFDPTSAEVITTPEAIKPEDFEFFRKRIEKQAAMGRMLLIVVLLLAVGANLLMTLRTQDLVIDNVNQARHDQAQLDERLLTKVTAIETQVGALAQQLEALSQAEPEPAPVE
jgi:uncharacterized protein HemX